MPRRIIHSLARASALALLATAVPIMASPQGPGDGVRIRHEAIRLGPRTLDADGGITAPFTFKMAGVSWTGDDASDTDHNHREVKVRVSSGHRWGPWTTLEEMHDEGPDAVSREDRGTATFPVWVGDGERIQVRGAPHGATLHLIDPGPDPAQPLLRSAGAQPDRPTIVSRAQWGADESIRRGNPSYASNVRFAIVHHTATDNGYSASEAPGVVRSMYAYHVNARGWDDIGYNALVDRYGRIYEGRAGGLERAVIGAHAKGFNTGSTGVALIGTFSGSVPSAAYDSLKRFLAWKLDVHHVDPHWRVTVRSAGSDRYAEGTNVSLNTISAHRDTGHTGCPGDGGYSILDRLRSEVASLGRPKIYDPTTNRGAITPNGDGHADSVAISTRGNGIQAWTAKILDQKNASRWTTQGTGLPSFTWNGRDQTGSVLKHGWYTIRIEATDTGGQSARPAHLRVLVGAWPEGSLVKGSGPQVYVIRNGMREHYKTPENLLSTYRWGEIGHVPDDPIHAIRFNPDAVPGFREGSLIRTRDGYVWLISDGKRRHIRSPADFERLGLRWDAIIEASNASVQMHPVGTAVDPSRHPNGSLVRGSGPHVYWIVGGSKRHVPSPAVFSSWFRWNEVAVASDAELAVLPVGAPVQFRDATLIRAKNDPKIYVVDGGQKRWISSYETFVSLGYSMGNVLEVSTQEAAGVPQGPEV